MTQKQQDELTRALEIAREKGHKVFTGKSRQTGATIYTVRSASEKNLFHILYIEAGRIRCDCHRSKSGHICSHAAAVRLFLIEQREALAAIEEAEKAGIASVAHSEPQQTASAPQASSQPTQAPIKRNPATALYGDDTYKGSIFKPERPVYDDYADYAR